MTESYRRSNDGSPLEVEASTAGASGDRDLEEWLAYDTEKWLVRARRLEETLNAIPGVSATVEVIIEESVPMTWRINVKSAHC